MSFEPGKLTSIAYEPVKGLSCFESGGKPYPVGRATTDPGFCQVETNSNHLEVERKPAAGETLTESRARERKERRKRAKKQNYQKKRELREAIALTIPNSFIDRESQIKSVKLIGDWSEAELEEQRLAAQESEAVFKTRVLKIQQRATEAWRGVKTCGLSKKVVAEVQILAGDPVELTKSQARNKRRRSAVIRRKISRLSKALCKKIQALEEEHPLPRSASVTKEILGLKLRADKLRRDSAVRAAEKAGRSASDITVAAVKKILEDGCGKRKRDSLRIPDRGANPSYSLLEDCLRKGIEGAADACQKLGLSCEKQITLGAKAVFCEVDSPGFAVDKPRKPWPHIPRTSTSQW